MEALENLKSRRKTNKPTTNQEYHSIESTLLATKRLSTIQIKLQARKAHKLKKNGAKKISVVNQSGGKT